MTTDLSPGKTRVGNTRSTVLATNHAGLSDIHWDAHAQVQCADIWFAQTPSQQARTNAFTVGRGTPIYALFKQSYVNA